MLKDLKFKQKAIALVGSAVVATLSFLFQDPLTEFLLKKVTVPIWIFPLTIALSVSGVFFIRWLLLFRNYLLQDMRMILKNGHVIGVFNGPSNVTFLEWSWLDPRILLVETQDGHILRIHYSLVIFYR